MSSLVLPATEVLPNAMTLTTIFHLQTPATNHLLARAFDLS